MYLVAPDPPWHVASRARSPRRLCAGRVIVASHYLPYTVSFPTRTNQDIVSRYQRNPLPGPFEPDSLTADHPQASTESWSSSYTQRSDIPTFSRKISDALHVPTASEPLTWKIEPFDAGNIGLFNAIESVNDSMERIYVGQPRVEVPMSVREAVCAELEALHCVPVHVPDAVASDHYEKFCKQVLWPLFHYAVPDIFRSSSNAKSSWEHYIEVNKLFAERIIQIYQPGDIVWVHDYHLMLVPTLVREKFKDAMIGFFLHIPFPSSEIFRCLHVRKEVLEGILGANLVGFQTYSFARHFLQTCSRILGFETTPSSVHTDHSVVAVGIFPIGINAEALMRKRESGGTSQILSTMRRSYSGMKVLIGRDKLDYIKGVPHKLLAFEQFLETYPEWRGKVIFIQVATLSASNRELEAEIQNIVTRINGRFGSLPYTPVIYHHQNISFDQYIALLTIADLCLITSLRDGMNLTAHEYIVCQKDQCNPLILSEFAGTYGSLGGALRVNPWDQQHVAATIHEALTMSEEERKLKHAELFRYITTHSAQFWVESFLSELQKVAVPIVATVNENFRSDIDTIIGDYKSSKSRLIVLGYDGTLLPFKKDADAAVPSTEHLQLLDQLTSDEHNSVYILSGRSRTTLDQWFGGVGRLGLGAENGCFLKMIGEDWVGPLSRGDLGWRDKVMAMLEYFTERTEGSSIELKEVMLTWHYRAADQRFGAWQAKELMNHLEDAIGGRYAVQVVAGRKTIDVRPSNVSKVTSLKRILSTHSFDFVLCIGSDTSDDDLFEFVRSTSFEKSCPSENTARHICSVSSAGPDQDGIHLGSKEVLQLLSRLSQQ